MIGHEMYHDIETKLEVFPQKNNRNGELFFLVI
jgi:hypothetical protein